MKSRSAWQRLVLTWVVLALALAPLSGCQTLAPAPKTIQLAAVIIDGRLARPDELKAVRVVRAGVLQGVTAGMALQPGDRVQTGPGAYAVIHWPSRSEVYMRPGSSAEVSSLVDAVGEFFVKVRGHFAVKTKLSSAVANGTAFLVRGQPNGALKVTVFDGQVILESQRNLWPAVRVAVGSTATASLQLPRPVPASEAELQETREWVESVEKALPTQISGISMVMGMGIAVLTLWKIFGSRGRDDKQPPTTESGKGVTGR